MKLLDGIIILCIAGIIYIDVKMITFIPEEPIFFLLFVFFNLAIFIFFTLFGEPLLKITTGAIEIIETKKSLGIKAIKKDEKTGKTFFLLEDGDHYYYKYNFEKGYKDKKISKSRNIVIVEDPNLKDNGIINYYKKSDKIKKDYPVANFLIGWVVDSSPYCSFIEIRIPPESTDWTINLTC